MRGIHRWPFTRKRNEALVLSSDFLVIYPGYLSGGFLALFALNLCA
jgi:hypothetical protein